MYFALSRQDILKIASEQENFSNIENKIFWSDIKHQCKIEVEINPLTEYPISMICMPYTTESLENLTNLLNKNFYQVTENMWEKLSGKSGKEVVIKHSNSANTEYRFEFFHTNSN